MKKIVLGLIVAILSFTFAQNVVVDTQSIVVNPKPSFDVDVWADRDKSGQAMPRYQIGENILLGVSVSEDAYVYLFNVRSNGEINQILPNRFDQEGQNNYIVAGTVKYFPPRDASYTFLVDGPTGIDKVIALASKEVLDISALASYANNPNFATSNLGQEQFAQTLSIVVQPKPQQSWVTDTISFEVTDLSAPVNHGVLDLNTSPSGAEVFIFGEYAGLTPLQINTKVGNYQVEFRLANHRSHEAILEVLAARTTSFSTSLEAINQNATLNIGSSPSGAEIYLDGQYIGISPITVTVVEGNHDLELRLAGYLNYSRSIYTEGGQTAVINPVLEFDNIGQVYFNSEPAGADVYVNNNYLGKTPLGPIALAEGNYSAKISFSGYPDESREFSIKARKETTLSVQFSNLNAPQTYIDDYTGLSLFPGARIIYQDYNKHGTYIELEVDSDISTIFDDLNSQLFLKGWQRVYHKPKRNQVKAKYQLNGVELYIELKKSGNDEFNLDIYY